MAAKKKIINNKPVEDNKATEQPEAIEAAVPVEVDANEPVQPVELDDTNVVLPIDGELEAEVDPSQDENTPSDEPVNETEPVAEPEPVNETETIEEEDGDLEEPEIITDEEGILALLESDIGFNQKIEIINAQTRFLDIRVFIATLADYQENMKDFPVNGGFHVNQLQAAVSTAFKGDDELKTRIYLNILDGYFAGTHDKNSAFTYSRLTRLSEEMTISEENITQTHMLYLAISKLAAGERDVYVESIVNLDVVEKLKKFYKL